QSAATTVYTCLKVAPPTPPGTCPSTAGKKVLTMPQSSSFPNSLASGGIGYAPLPPSGLAPHRAQITQTVGPTPDTSTSLDTTFEVWFSRCPGDYDDPLRTYKSSPIPAWPCYGVKNY